MTPIQKAKEIVLSYIDSIEGRNGATIPSIDLWLSYPSTAALLSGEDWKEDVEEKDRFAIAFAAWCIGSEGEMYRASGVSASKLLQLYKDRPYINTDPKIN